MPDRVLQKRYCVAALQRRLLYNVIMILTANQQSDKPMAPRPRAAGTRRAPPRFPRYAGALAVTAAVAVLAAACGASRPSSSPGSASTGSATYRADLAYAQCMRAHGLPSFPKPIPSAVISFTRRPNGSPESPAARANEACKHLLSSTSTGAGSTTATATASPPGTVAADCLTVSQCYAPHQFLVAYGVQPLLDRGITGHGVTVVLPEEAETGPARPPPITDLLQSVTDIRQDVAEFDSRFGLPPAKIQVVTTFAGSSASPWLAGVEEVEDTELVHAVAPDATILSFWSTQRT